MKLYLQAYRYYLHNKSYTSARQRPVFIAVPDPREGVFGRAIGV